MRQALRFPVEYRAWGDGELEVTFEALAIPPRHELVSSVFGWVFHGDELLLVRQWERGWNLPGGPRQPGETFRQTLARAAWKEAGALLESTRLIGAVRSTNRGPDNRQSPGAGSVSYTVCCLAEVRELLPFSAEFEADDRILIEPRLISKYVQHWSPLMDEMLEFARAVRVSSPVEALA